MTLGLGDMTLLHDALRPPRGMEIAAAVGTTFTLDLTALLAIPVGATLGADDDGGTEDKADLLETIRRYAERTVLFCQAGAISVPPQYRAAMTFIEQTVIEIRRPQGGLFHPKIWVLRFEGGGWSTHRVLIMTRNLTFDNALDVMVRLDEDPDTDRPIDARKLVGTLEGYPALAARQASARQLQLIGDLCDTLRAARLAAPEPFTRGRFVPGAPGNHQRPFARTCDNALAVSPFLAGEPARSFLSTASWSGLISRRGSLDRIADELQNATRVMHVKDTVEIAQDAVEAEVETQADQPDGPKAPTPAARGLHAKIYVQDSGETSTMWIGSANLTRAAFGLNHEMLIALTGPTRAVGVDAILDPRGQRSDLSQLVEDHNLSTPSVDDEDEEELAALSSQAYDLASGKLTLTATEFGDTWTVDLVISPWSPDPSTAISVRLLSLRHDFVPVVDGTASWAGLDLTAITPFVVVLLEREGLRRSILIRADMIGDPDHRRDYVLAHAIKSREDFLRYLSILLGMPYGGLVRRDTDSGVAPAFWQRSGLRVDRILEDLLQAAARDRDRLESLTQTLAQLDSRPETRDFIPDDFREVWAAVREALHGPARKTRSKKSAA